MIQLVSTIPVMAQMMTVSQKVPVDDTNACLTGLRVCAAAATIGAEPSPDSLENSPLAIPNRAAIITDVPTKPPPAACGLNADSQISRRAGQTYAPLMKSITMHPIAYSKAMKGTSISHTLAILFTPPKITAAVRAHNTAPVI